MLFQHTSREFIEYPKAAVPTDIVYLEKVFQNAVMFQFISKCLKNNTDRAST